MTPQLALAALHRALADACGSMPDYSRASAAHRRIREEGPAFWMAEEGEWAESREILCDAAQVHPEKARAFALKKIAQHADDEGPQKPHSFNSRAERNAEIVARYTAGERVEDLAVQYKLSMTTVYHIVNPKRRA